jgi:hypothetical protein
METIREKNRIILEFDRLEDAEKVQRAIEAHKYLQIIQKSRASEEDIEQIANEINQAWWEENKQRFIK